MKKRVPVPREEVLRIADEFMPDPPGALTVNGVEFTRVSSAAKASYAGPAQGRISFLSLDYDPGQSPPEIPRELTVSGRRFTRRCETYFLPLDVNAGDVQALFDYMAPRYNEVTNVALNALVSRHLLEESLRDTDVDSPVRVLDYGCGLGTTWRELNRLAATKPALECVELYGCDLSPKMVQGSHRIGFFRASQCEYASTGFGTDFFDVILATFVMHYFVDAAPFEEIRKILKPGGLLIASLPMTERHDLDHYAAVLDAEPGMGKIEISEFETQVEQPRRTHVVRCRKLKTEPTSPAGTGLTDPKPQTVT